MERTAANPVDVMSEPIKTFVVAGLAALGLAAGLALPPRSAGDPTDLVILPAASFDYRVAGQFLRDGQPVNPPLEKVTFHRPVAIMKNNVSLADYQRCVAARACKPVDAGLPKNADVVPAVGVSWYDAVAYAAWLSRETGHHYRLPTDSEWAYAAANLFHDNTVVEDGDAANPAQRWLAIYARTAASERSIDSRPQPFGTFGLNENGLADVAGNIWNWTSSCYVSHSADSSGSNNEMASCGVRVVEGAHRTYLTDFVRDPKGGACSVGTPPNNLGIRLVRDDDDGIVARLAGILQAFAS